MAESSRVYQCYGCEETFDTKHYTCPSCGLMNACSLAATRESQATQQE